MSLRQLQKHMHNVSRGTWNVSEKEGTTCARLTYDSEGFVCFEPISQPAASLIIVQGAC